MRWNNLLKRLFPRTHTTSPIRRNSIRPHLESLEDRALPTTSTNITTNAVVNLAPANAAQGAVNVPILSFEVTTASLSGEKFKQMSVHYTGTSAPDVSSVHLYQESGTIAGSSFDPATDTLLVTKANAANVTLNPTAFVPLATNTTYKFYLVVDISGTA